MGTCTVFLKIIIEYFITDAYAAATTTTEAAADRTYLYIILYSKRNISPHSARAEPIGI